MAERTGQISLDDPPRKKLCFSDKGKKVMSNNSFFFLLIILHKTKMRKCKRRRVQLRILFLIKHLFHVPFFPYEYVGISFV